MFHHMMGGLPDGVFLDLGANVGVITAQALAYGYDVIAFEPDPTALAQLRKRFANHEKVRIIPKPVGASARTATFYHFPTNTIASSLIKSPENAGGGTIEVDVVDLVEFIRQMDRPVAGIKMDIEGAEAECLEAILDAGLHKSVGYILAECHDGISAEIKKRLDTIRQRIREEEITNINLEWI
jgi:FkbM family methyltransferase